MVVKNNVETEKLAGLKSRNDNLPETILSETEAAKYLKVSRPTLHRWRKSGAIKYYRAGFRVLYSVENHLRPFLEICEQIADNEKTIIKDSKESA